MREVVKVWRPGVSKVQYRMNLIDAIGRPVGGPHSRNSRRRTIPRSFAARFLRTMAYTTPPGTGNAYSRDFVAECLYDGSGDDP